MKKFRTKKVDIPDAKIIISDDGDDTIKTYICPYCNFTMSTRLSDGYVWCQRCAVEFPIKDIRKKSKLETPKGRDTETLVSSIPSPHEKDLRIKHGPQLQGGFKALSEKEYG